MTKWIISPVVGGIPKRVASFVPEALAAHCGTFITVGLCLILFLVGVDEIRGGRATSGGISGAAGFKVADPCRCSRGDHRLCRRKQSFPAPHRLRPWPPAPVSVGIPWHPCSCLSLLFSHPLRRGFSLNVMQGGIQARSKRYCRQTAILLIQKMAKSWEFAPTSERPAH